MLSKYSDRITVGTFFITLLSNYTFGVATFSVASQLAIFATVVVFLFIKASNLVGKFFNIPILQSKQKHDKNNPELLNLPIMNQEKLKLINYDINNLKNIEIKKDNSKVIEISSLKELNKVDKVL